MEFEGLLPIFGIEKGDASPLIIAGPCSAENRSQTLETASLLQASGIRYFRAGVWKPRTRPGCFDGVGSPALRWLSEVQEKKGMRVLTEVATPSHLRQALRAGIRAFWIGARTSANPFAMQELCDYLSRLSPEEKDEITILVKNPVNPDLELWIGALQRLYNAGIRRLGAIHRGFSVYAEHFYRNAPEWSIPFELKRRIPEIPLICDPSHIGGKRDLVGPLSQQAIDMNFDGLIIESHCSPDEALSDAAQQVTPTVLSEILRSLKTCNRSTDKASLTTCRAEIDRIDDELMRILAERMEVSRRIGEIKRREGLPVVQPERYNELIERRMQEGKALGMHPEFMRRLLAEIHEESVRQQLQ